MSTPNPNSSAGTDARAGEPAGPSLSAADAAHERDALPIAGFQGTPEEIERQWYERLPRARRPDAPAHLAGGPHGLGARGRPLAHQPLYRPQGGLGLRCGDHGVHPLVRHLDHAAPSPHRAHTHDHPREQLHAVHGELGGLLDRRNAHFRFRGLHAHHQQHLAAPGDARVGVLPRGARGDHGDSHEAADDQHRAASLPEWHRGRRNAARAPLRRGQGHALRQGAWAGRDCSRSSASSGPTASCW